MRKKERETHTLTPHSLTDSSWRVCPKWSTSPPTPASPQGLSPVSQERPAPSYTSRSAFSPVRCLLGLRERAARGEERWPAWTPHPFHRRREHAQDCDHTPLLPPLPSFQPQQTPLLLLLLLRQKVTSLLKTATSRVVRKVRADCAGRRLVEEEGRHPRGGARWAAYLPTSQQSEEPWRGCAVAAHRHDADGSSHSLLPLSLRTRHHTRTGPARPVWEKRWHRERRDSAWPLDCHLMGTTDPSPSPSPSPPPLLLLALPGDRGAPWRRTVVVERERESTG